MNDSEIRENQNYRHDVEDVIRLYRGGADKENVLEKLIECFEKYNNPEYRAHFLYMTSHVFQDLDQKEAAYEVCIKTEKLFPGTLFARVAADISKSMFVDEGGRFTPMPTFTPSVQVEPTNYCNLNCIMCGRNQKRQLGHMSFDMFKKIVDQSLTGGASAIRLYHMGEPLLNKSIIKFVEYFNHKVRGFDLRPPCIPRGTGIMTNGTVLSEDLANRLMKVGLSAIGFSIDGRSSEEFEKIREGAKFANVIDKLNKVRRIRDMNGYSTRISVSVLDMALDDNDKIRLNELYRRNGADSVSFMPCSPVEGRHVVNKDGDIISAETSEKALFSALNTSSKDCDRTTGRASLDRMVVLWNGDIKSSCGEPAPGDIIGNINEISLIDAYQIKMRNLGYV